MASWLACLAACAPGQITGAGDPSNEPPPSGGGDDDDDNGGSPPVDADPAAPDAPPSLPAAADAPSASSTPDARCSGPEPLASDGPWTCGGLTGTTTNPDGTYYTTSFGCWVDESGGTHSDAGDNCIPACSLSSIGCSGMTGPQCERFLNWYTADADRFGCGTRLKVTNVDGGVAAVLVAIDRGPNCSIEGNVDFWVLDMSYRASYHLFGGPTSAGERAAVQVEVVPSSTPLGPVAVNACF